MWHQIRFRLHIKGLIIEGLTFACTTSYFLHFASIIWTIFPPENTLKWGKTPRGNRIIWMVPPLLTEAVLHDSTVQPHAFTCSNSSPGSGSSLRAAVSTVDGGAAMCSAGGLWAGPVSSGSSSDCRGVSGWFWVGVVCNGSTTSVLTVQKFKTNHTDLSRGDATSHRKVSEKLGNFLKYNKILSL